MINNNASADNYINATITLPETKANAEELFAVWLKVWQRVKELDDPEMNLAASNMCAAMTKVQLVLAQKLAVSPSDIVPLGGIPKPSKVVGGTSPPSAS